MFLISIGKIITIQIKFNKLHQQRYKSVLSPKLIYNNVPTIAGNKTQSANKQMINILIPNEILFHNRREL